MIPEYAEVFHEDTFPWPEKPNHLEFGYAQMSKLCVGILLLARDASERLESVTRRVTETGRLFKKYFVHVYENDSKDNTVELLEAWKRRDPSVSFSSETLNRKKWRSVRSGRRGWAMARLRNACKSRAYVQLSQCTDAVIVIDADLPGWSNDGLADTFARWGAWDAMFSNSVRWRRDKFVHADVWAWRPKKTGWKERPWKELHKIVPQRGDPLIPVNSAFGGLGVYRTEPYLAVDYAGTDCEHVLFHKAMVQAGYSRLYMNPSQISLYGPNRKVK